MATAPPEDSPLETGQVVEKPQSRCDVCGTVGPTIELPDRPPPNHFCLKCAVEYGDQAGGDYEDF